MLPTVPFKNDFLTTQFKVHPWMRGLTIVQSTHYFTSNNLASLWLKEAVSRDFWSWVFSPNSFSSLIRGTLWQVSFCCCILQSYSKKCTPPCVLLHRWIITPQCSLCRYTGLHWEKCKTLYTNISWSRLQGNFLCLVGYTGEWIVVNLVASQNS